MESKNPQSLKTSGVIGVVSFRKSDLVVPWSTWNFTVHVLKRLWI